MTSDTVGPARWRRDGTDDGQRQILPEGLFRYVAVTSWMHQLPLVTLTVTVFLLEVVPLELQRRVVNDVVKTRQYSTVILLCAITTGRCLYKAGPNLVSTSIARGSASEQPAICVGASALRSWRQGPPQHWWRIKAPPYR